MPVVWELSVIHLSNNKTLISGVILQNTPYTYQNKKGLLRNIISIFKSYFTNTYSNQSISLSSNQINSSIVTDDKGGFQIVFPHLHENEVKVFSETNQKAIKIAQTYPIIFKETDSSFDVISDIDDTILISKSPHPARRIANLLFKSPFKRKVISFTKSKLEEFQNQQARIFYVSKSESNLFGYLTSFITLNNLPRNPLFLTPYLNMYQLIRLKKGKDFKFKKISFLLENSDSKKYVLFGDDGQSDLETYLSIILQFPQKIISVYIRKTKKKLTPFQEETMRKLISTQVPINHF